MKKDHLDNLNNSSALQLVLNFIGLVFVDWPGQIHSNLFLG